MRTDLCLALLLGSGCVLIGCDGDAGSTSAAPKTTEARIVDTGPTQVELGAAQAQWREPEAEIVQFEIPYRFASGSPRKVYQCRVTFPDDGAAGVKPMEAWELKQEGVIKTGIPGGGKIVKAYRIEFFEAEAPDKEYIRVSNTVTGEVPPPPVAEPAESKDIK